METQYIITAILLIQFLLAGYFIGDQINFADSKMKIFITGIAFALLGLPYLFLMLVSGLIEKFIQNYRLKFIFKYILLKKKLEYSERGGKELHEKALLLNPKWWQLSDRLFIYIDKWVAKNYPTKNDNL